MVDGESWGNLPLPVSTSKDPNQQFINCTSFTTFCFLRGILIAALGIYLRVGTGLQAR
jgi:hypothetical protein